MRLVIFINAVLVVGLSVMMALCGLIFRDDGGALFEGASDAGMLGLLIALATARPRYEQLRRGEAFVLTASVWVSGAVAGALPLWHWGLTGVDAFFEAISGLTTTGSTVMSGLEATPRGILMWRAIMQAVGGIGFVVTGIALLPMLRIGGMQLFRTESSEQGQLGMQSAGHFAKASLLVYAGLIFACWLAYRAGGMTDFDAAVHALTTLSSGGYSNYDASFGHFDSPFLQWSCTFFMFCSGLPFAWYVRAATRSTFASEQIRAMLISCGTVIAILWAWQVVYNGAPPMASLRAVAFNVISVVTTTGYATEDYTLWGGFAVAVFFVLTASGGCTGSTSGGVKAMRWIILARNVRVQLRRFVSPHSVSHTYYEGKRVNQDVLDGVIGFFTFFMLSFFLLATALAMEGLDTQTALSGALTALANVGPGVGDVIGPAGNFATLDDSAKMLLAFGMYLGRLEMLTVFVLFTPAFWQEI